MHTTYTPSAHTEEGGGCVKALCKHLPTIYQLRWIQMKQSLFLQFLLQSVSVCFTSQCELHEATLDSAVGWYGAWQHVCDSAYECEPSSFHMVAALLPCCYPNLKRTHVDDPGAVPHRMLGGDFLLWLPQKSGGRDYDKSLFHARHGLFSNLRFTKSILGIIDAGASLWVKRLRVWAISWE